MMGRINLWGLTSRVDAAKYNAMKKAYLEVLPATEPGLTFRDLLEQIPAHLPDDLFPGGAIRWLPLPYWSS